MVFFLLKTQQRKTKRVFFPAVCYVGTRLPSASSLYFQNVFHQKLKSALSTGLPICLSVYKVQLLAARQKGKQGRKLIYLYMNLYPTFQPDTAGTQGGLQP